MSYDVCNMLHSCWHIRLIGVRWRISPFYTTKEKHNPNPGSIKLFWESTWNELACFYLLMYEINLESLISLSFLPAQSLQAPIHGD